jgi:phytoene dehydrogenase-like protein
MQAIPDAALKGLNSHGGVLKLNTEVTEILVKDNEAYGVKTKDGTEYDPQGRRGRARARGLMAARTVLPWPHELSKRAVGPGHTCPTERTLCTPVPLHEVSGA